MAFIGSSPLGLTFYSTKDESSKGGVKPHSKIGSKELRNTGEVGSSNLYRSLFGNSGFAPYPESINTDSSNKNVSIGSVTSLKGAKTYHSTDTYDTSISSLLTYTQNHRAMRLLAADFAYLKNVGVFPNNRLMIARRFAGPVKDDLTSYGKNGPVPLSTMVSWTPDGNDFISISFGEEWVDAESSFKEVLNDIGKDMKASQDQRGGLGNAASMAFGAIPLPGFMEGLQYRVLEKMGLSDDKSISGLPGGNPNLIREAKRRKTLDSETAGSGLKASVEISMKVEYEQKFINGVDPTLVYFDIISNILSFGTSEASFQFAGAFGAGISKTLQQFISGDIKGIISGIKDFLTSLIQAIAEIGRDLIEKLINPPSNGGKVSADTLYNAFVDIFKGTIGATIGKYKIRIQGIANALSGAYSTPWHITIGNPKKPMFSSGDMYTTDVKMTMGPILAFNDLPSSISVEFTLKNARSLGSQEIFNKFNASGGRTYKRLNLSFADTKVVASKNIGNISINQTSSTLNSDGSKNITTSNAKVGNNDIQLEPYDVIDRETESSIVDSEKISENREGTSGDVAKSFVPEGSGETTTQNTNPPDIPTNLNT